MTRRFASFPVVRSLLIVCAFGLCSTAHGRVFEHLTSRYPVGDPTAENPIASTEGPKNVACGDLDGDGLADVVTANLDGSVSVLISDGEGGARQEILVPARELLEHSSLRDVVVLDFDGDGHADVAAADVARDAVVLLQGIGDGQLVPVASFPFGAVRSLAAADVNGDGAVDILAGGSPADCEQWSRCPDSAVPATWCLHEGVTPPSLAILLGFGDGSFADPTFLLENHEGCLYDVDLADLDADGNIDALAMDMTNRHVLLFAGRGDGTFAPPLELRTQGSGPRALCVGYLDERVPAGEPAADATLDIAVANRNSATLDLFFHRGGFEFDAPVPIPAGDSPRDIAAGDLDGDGLVELVTTNRNASTLSVFEGLGAGRFPSLPLELATGTSPRNVVLADLTGDGSLDAAVNNRVSEDVSIFVGKPGLSGFLVPKNLYPAGLAPVDVTTADFDADGHPDVATVALRSHELQVRLNLGDGLLGESTAYEVNYEPNTVVASDVNRDGRVDLIVACLGQVGVVDSRNASALLVLIGRGDGTFSPPTPASTGTVGFRPCSVRLADLSGDGIDDLAVGGLQGELALYRGRGDGTFDPQVRLPSKQTGRPLNFALGDFDGDGRVDIATSQAWLLLNNGRFFSPGWSGEKRYVAENTPRPVDTTWYVDAADLDADGNLDLMLALTFERPDPIAVFFGQGDGTFHPPDIYDGPDMGVVASIATDVDGDGITDILIGNRCAANVIVLQGQGDRKFKRVETVSALAVDGLAVDDLDGDGRPDLIGVGLGLWVLLNGRASPLVEPGPGNLPGTLPREGVYMNELMALNQESYEDGNGDTPDWIELFNFGPEPANLQGWQLRQHTRGGQVRTWRFPADTSIGPFGHLVIFVGLDRPSPGPIEGITCTAFGLHRGGETLVLLDASGSQVDRVAYPALAADLSYARFVDGARFFSYNRAPTIGSANVRPTNLEPTIAPENPFRADAAGVGVTASVFDDVGIAYVAACYRLPDATAFAEVALVDDGDQEDGFAGDGVFGAALPGVPAGATVLYFLRAVDIEGDQVTVPGDPSREESLFCLELPPEQPTVQISEVLTDNEQGLLDDHGETEDWLELENCGEAPVSLAGLELTKDFFDEDGGWALPSDVTLAPGERLVVFCDKDPHQGPLHATFRLDNDGDQVLLIRRGETVTIIDSMTFDRLDDDRSFGRLACGEPPRELGEPTPGAPNRGGVRFRRGDSNGSGSVDLSDAVFTLLFLFAQGPRPPCEDSADGDDSGAINLTDPIHLLNHLFASGPAPAPPYPDCGFDLTRDELPCDEYGRCE